MNGSRDALEIRTPEGIVFTLPLAGPLTRFLAWGVDLAAIGATTSLLASLMTALGFVLGDVARALYAIFYFALSIGYGMACEWLLRGQTLGKWLLGLRVVDEQGLRLEPHQILVRNLLRVVDSLPVFYLVGGAAMFLSRRSQRLGDYAANTVVIRATQPSLPDLEQLLAVKYNSLRGHPHLAARLRQRLAPEEAMLAARALLRRDELDPLARVALFHDLAAHYQRLVPYPPDVVEPLADEPYVRNVADIVFGSERHAADPREGPVRSPSARVSKRPPKPAV